MKVIGLGSNCDVAFFLKKHYPGEYYPFDWIWSNIEFVIKTFETDMFDFAHCETLTPKWEPGSYHTYFFNNGCTGGKDRICSAASLHDADHYTPDTINAHIPIINEKYKRRFQRLYDTLNSDENIIIVRKVLDKHQGAVKLILDSKESITHLMNLFKKKYKAHITLCLVDDGYFHKEEIHKDVKCFQSFDELLPFLKQAESQGLNLLYQQQPLSTIS
jgi:hypothetical protein